MSDMPELSSPDYDPVDELLECLDIKLVGTSHVQYGEGEQFHLSDADRDMFLGQSLPQPLGRVFGGQVLAQTIIAAGRTVQCEHPGRRIHSMHGYFLRPGDASKPITFLVERMHDGRSFSARRVHAIQNDKAILSMISSFQDAAEGMDHQDQMPPAPRPELLPTTRQLLAGVTHPVVEHWMNRRAIDLRHCEEDIYLKGAEHHNARQQVWFRTLRELPDDQLLHAAVLAYASDYTMLESSLRKHGIAWADGRLRPASLDHAMWFHRELRADDWVLFTEDSPSASGGRGLGTGRMFSRDGRLMATVAQEGMLRLKG